MIQNLSYTEMNQAVPGSILSTRMERHLECEVPSPSQWSDSCRSPPSLHSPVHFSLELEKLKEEPYSPLSYHNLPSYTAHLMSKENSSEASINLAELLAENSSLVGSIQQQPQQQQQQQQHNLQPKVEYEQTTFESCFDFLDSLVEIKQENDDQNYLIPVVTTVAATAQVSTSDSVTPSCSVSKPTPQTQATTVQANLSLGDRLRTVELMALDHWRQDVQNISNQLSIPKDPAAWSVANVRSWLEFEAEKQGLPSPPNIELYNLNGMELIGLTEAQFRKFIPRGELLYAKLEIWLEALRPSYQLEVPLPGSSEIQANLPSVYTSQPQGSTQYPSLQFHTSPSSLQPLSVHVSYYNQPPMYQSPSSSCVPEPMFSPSSSTMLSPPPPTSTPSVQQLSPSQSHSQPSESPSLLPTTVIQVGRQQQLKHKISEIDSPLPTKRQRSQSPSSQIRNSFLEEACLDMSSLLQQGCGEVSKPQPSPQQQTSAADTTRDIPESGDEVEEESPSVSTGRGGTHIHLWQFLKELLVRPQLYAPYIRWLDRQAGIFKIEDSTRVAKLWGERKNRPAMNYDKLSRSIRQYYKKGIMKKTERSQRLVYQFCHPYGS